MPFKPKDPHAPFQSRKPAKPKPPKAPRPAPVPRTETQGQSEKPAVPFKMKRLVKPASAPPKQSGARPPQKRTDAPPKTWTDAPPQKRTDAPPKTWTDAPPQKRTDASPQKRTDAPPKKKKTGAAGCPLYKKCGGCQLQNLTYPEQLAYKQRKVQRLLDRFCPISPIVGMERPYHYRNKVQAAFGRTRDGKTISGVYQSSTQRIVPVERCMTEDVLADEIIGTIRKLTKDFRIEPYEERTGQGLLRHVLVKRGFASGQVMVVLVTASPILPAKRNLVAALCKAHPQITTILQNINTGYTNLVLGDRELLLYGPGYIEDTLCGCTFAISAKSFYQINPIQTEVLYGKAIEYAGLTGKETVIDAYCGIGTIGLIAAKQAGQVIGVEVNADAAKDARANAKRNNAGNIRFVCADASLFMEEMAAHGEHADVVFLDPPRSGSDERFLSSLVRLAPSRVVYISCNPETQARDLEYLQKNGYRAEKLTPVDMFPHTNHVESVALLRRIRAEG